jgi:signal transduction histidine kinase
MPMMRNNICQESFTTAIKGDEAAFPFNHPRFGNRFLMLGLPVRTSEGISGVLLINMPLAPVEETASIIKLQLIYITLLLLAASLLISFRLAQSFTGPILAIKNASQRMASGDYSVRIAIRKSDEIGQLAESVNYLGEQLSKVEQLRKDLIANVSHELRTPLSLIRGYAETIRDITGKTPEKREKQLEIIIEETERLGRIVDDILHLSQLQAGYIALKKRPFDVRKKLAALVDRYYVLGKEAGVSVRTEIPEDIWAMADEDRIEQVIINLLNNSISHTPRGGSILIRAMENSETIRFEISDTGSGIPEEEIPYIWDRFYKADKTRKLKASGTGLGLAIVKGVLEAHQAVFGVESKQGQGSIFWFELKRYI